MDILVSTLCSPVSSSGYGSAEEDHSLSITFPDFSSRRYSPLSTSSDTGSDIFSFSSTASSSLQSSHDVLLPETLGCIFGDLLDFEEELPNLDLSCGLSFTDDSVLTDPRNAGAAKERNYHLSNDITDHIDEHLNDPSNLGDLRDLCRYFHPDDIGSNDSDFSTNVDQPSTIDLEEETGSDGSGEGPKESILLPRFLNTTTRNIPISTQSGTTNETATRRLGYFADPTNIDDTYPRVKSFSDAQTLPMGPPKDELYRTLNDNISHSTDFDASIKPSRHSTESESFCEEVKLENRGCNSFTMLLALTSNGAAETKLSETFPTGIQLLGDPAATEHSRTELPQGSGRASADTRSSTTDQKPIRSVLSRTLPGGSNRSPETVNPSRRSPFPRTAEAERRKSVSPVIHDPIPQSPLHRKSGGVKRSRYSELEDHRYSTRAPPDSDPAPASKTPRKVAGISGTRMATGSSRFTYTGSGKNRRSEKTILETFLLTTEKLHANKGSDAMLAEDNIARLYSGQSLQTPAVLKSLASGSSSAPTSSSSTRSSVLERLLTECGRRKPASTSTNKEDHHSATTHHCEDTPAGKLRHVIIANAAATPCVQISTGSHNDQAEKRNFIDDSIALQLGLLADEPNEECWTPSSVDDMVFSNEMEAIIGHNLNPNDIWMHQYITDLL